MGTLCNVVNARFNDLLIDGLESEHMNYHLKKLLDLEFVEKHKERYRLTDRGKEYSGMMDDEVDFIEKQPKTSVLLHVVRKNKKGEVEHLLSRRLRHPYYGKIGRLTGKVRFGETLEEAARRELYEETGLRAKMMSLEEVYHKMCYDENDIYLQDTLFYRFFVKNPYGQLIPKTKHQENLWLTVKDVEDTKRYDIFDDLYLDDRFEARPLTFLETNETVKDY